MAEVIIKWDRENPTRCYASLKSPEIPSAFFSLSIFRLPQKNIYDWIVNEAAVQINIRIEEIQDSINKKNLLYDDYRKKCDECWLLLMINIFRDSQSFEISQIINHCFNSKFEKVFLMDGSYRKDLIELFINKI